MNTCAIVKHNTNIRRSKKEKQNHVSKCTSSSINIRHEVNTNTAAVSAIEPVPTIIIDNEYCFGESVVNGNSCIRSRRNIKKFNAMNLFMQVVMTILIGLLTVIPIHVSHLSRCKSKSIGGIDSMLPPVFTTSVDFVNIHTKTTTKKEEGVMITFVTDTTKPTTKYAYFFLIGGIEINDNSVDSSRSDTNRTLESYHGFYYNVVIATKLFRQQFQSEYDIHVMLQFTSNSTVKQLPENEMQLLQSVGIAHIHILPTYEVNNFSYLVYEKFRILNFVQYYRVMFIDGDIIPTNSLDYLLELSGEGVL